MEGFVDLRQNHGEQGLAESFWPSFTDIMTVVVMIFLIASTVLIVRNYELVAELRATLEAERLAEMEAAAAHETSRDLEDRLSQLQSTLSEMRIRNMKLTEENRDQRQQLAAQRQQMLALHTERDQIQEQANASARQVQLLTDRLQEDQQRFEQLQAENTRQDTRLQELVVQLEDLEDRHKSTLQELGEVRSERAAAHEQLTTLQEEYTSLDAKYQKLIKPARTAEGKLVAELRYRRDGKRHEIRLRAPGEPSYTTLTSAAMHQRLDALKAKHGEALYVKIIIPDDSGLTYNEAWDFTRDVLHRYDYYYQE